MFGLTLAVISIGLQPAIGAAATSAPVVTGVSPNSGPAGGGVAVTISGSGFTGATSVHFGTEPVAPTVNSDTSITVTSPPTMNTGPFDVTVFTPNGASTINSADLFTYGDTYTQVSTKQYSLPDSNGSTWRDMDAGGGLTLTISPPVNADAVLSGNADLWTANAGFNQDIGINVNGTIAAWKESGGFGGTFSPNAADVQTVFQMPAGTTYTVKLQWKTNKPAVGTTIFAGAGPINGQFSPTRLTAQLIPTAALLDKSSVSTQQYHLLSSDGSMWTDMDSTTLSLPYTPTVDGQAILSANADLWTAEAGFNQDLGIFIAGGSFGSGQLVAWKESGGFAGTFSPNAALVQAVVLMSAATSYTVKLQWKANRNATGATIWAGAGPIPSGSSTFSPTRLTLLFQPSGVVLTDKVSTQQYSLNSDGVTWMDLDAARLQATITPPSNCRGVLSGNADLWTANGGYNQDLGISVNGVLAAWKESGGFAGTFSPNAAFVQTVIPMSAATAYTVTLQWKANKPAAGATIYAGAGGPAPFSPTRLTVTLVACAGLPGPPSTVKATGGNAQATVSWLAPASNGSPITGYTVTATPATVPPVTVSGSTTSVTITSLANATTYNFAVRATNSAGTGPAGVTVTSVTVGAPGPPTSIGAISGSGQATVSWTPPSDNGSAINKYTVTSIPASPPVTVGGSAISATVTGLTNGTTYTFQVTATNLNGTGPAGNSSAVTIGVPGAPTNVRATTGNAQATVSWNPPLATNGSITGYTVTTVPATTPVPVGGSTLVATVTGLTNGTSYTFSVTASNGNGTGPPGSTSSPVLIGTPGAPINVRATPGNAQATVSWAPPQSDNGSPITGYTVTTLPATTSVNVPVSVTTTTVPGLTNGTAYSFQVTATNGIGTGPPGKSSQVTIGAPLAPTSIKAIGGNAQATVNWSPPASDNGSPILDYTVTAVIFDTGALGPSITVTVTTATVTGLTNGTKYKFQVYARNVNGKGPTGTSTTPLIVGAPGAPVGVHAAAGIKQATITWSAPPNNGSQITFYLVTATPSFAGQPVQVDASTTFVTITGLTSGTQYIFQVTATNSNGTGPAGTSNPVTPG